jgi:VWFA-related protein
VPATLRRWFWSVILILAMLASNASAFRPVQQSGPPAPPPGQAPPPKNVPPPAEQDPGAVVRINTQLVQIDVVVTDKKGAPVDDLGREEFELLVDGQPQSISHFTLVRLPEVKQNAPAGAKPDPKAAAKDDAIAPPGLPSKLIAPEKVRRTIAFVVDDLGLSFPSTYQARLAVKKFVDEQMRDGDLVGIIRTGRGLGALQQFTSDRRILYAAIENLTWNPLSRNMLPRFGADARVTAADDPAQQQTADFENFTDTSSSLGTLGALNFVVRSLSQLPGRKMIVFLSDGFNLYGTSGDETDTLNEARAVAELANRASVVIYSLDAKGLQTLMPGAGDNLNDVADDQLAQQMLDASIQNLDSQSGMVFLAQETGGFAVLNNNDLDLGVQQVLRDNQMYYLLGFDPEDEQFNGRYHTIRVRVKRPGLRVRTRGGFYGVTDAEAAAARPRTATQQILSTLYSPFGARDIEVRMTSFFSNSTAKGSYVRSLFHFDCANLSFKDGADHKKTLTLDLATFAFNEEGEAVDQYARTLTFDLDETQYRQALAKGLVYAADVPIKKPGPYQFRAVIRDSATGRLGSASQFIQVPDLKKKQLTLSGLIVGAPRAKAEEAAPGAALSAAALADPLEAQTLAANQQPGRTDAQPTPAVRRFARTGELEYGVWIFNAAADKRTNQPQLTMQIELFHNGKRIYQGAARPVKAAKGANLKRLPCVGSLKLTEFPRGDFMLRLIVTDALAKQKHARAEQWMDFSVR